VKTFEEALRSTMMQVHPAVEAEAKRITAEIEAGQASFRSLLGDIQGNLETRMLASGLLTIAQHNEWSAAELVIVAFSHGVMVGIEMEKQPLLVGRDLPPEAEKPTEAKE
jgi:hypothetical protein